MTDNYTEINNYSCETLLKRGDEFKECFKYKEAGELYKQVIEIIEKEKKVGTGEWIDVKTKLAEMNIASGDIENGILGYNQVFFLENDKYKKITAAFEASKGLIKKNNIDFEKIAATGLKIIHEWFPIKQVSVIILLFKEILIRILHEIFPLIFIRKKKKNNKKYIAIIKFNLISAQYYKHNNYLKYMRNILRSINLSDKIKELSIENLIPEIFYSELLNNFSFFKFALKKDIKIVKKFKELNLKQEYAQSLTQLGKTLLYKGEFLKSMVCYNDAYKIFLQYGDRMIVSELLSDIIKANYYLSDYKKMKISMNMLFNNLSLTKNIKNISVLYNLRIKYYFCAGKFEKIEKLALYNIELSRKNGFNDILADTCAQLGEYYSFTEFTEKGIEYLKMAIEISHLSSLKNNSSFYLVLLSEAYISDYLFKLNKGVIKGSDKLIKKIKKTVKKSVKQNKYSNIYYGTSMRVMAQYYYLTGDILMADEHFSLSIDFLTEINWKFQLGKTYLEYSKYLYQTGQDKNAQSRLEKSYNIFKDIEATKYLEKITEMGKINLKKLDGSLFLINFLEELLSISGFERSFIFKLESKNKLKLKKKIIFKNSEKSYQNKIITESIKNKKIIFINDNTREDEKIELSEEFKSILAIPLIFKDKIIGVFYFDSFSNKIDKDAVKKIDLKIQKSLLDLKKFIK